jgi:putative ABC transport system permease protein
MLRNYIVTALRFLAKNQMFASVNTIGLAVSISCAMLIYLYVKNELTYDEFHRDIDRLYILGEGSRQGGSPEEAAYYQTVYPALPAMMEEFPEIETGTRTFDWDSHILVANDKKFMQQVVYADSTFFQTLSFSLVKGNPETALTGKKHIVISEDLARRFFNTTDVLGKTIAFENAKEYVISGVMAKIPSNSSLRFEALLPLMEKEDEQGFPEMANWYNTIAQVFVKVKPGTDVRKLQAKFGAFVKQHYDAAAKERVLKLFPLADLRQSEASNETSIYGLMSIGIFILIIAVINFINLSIATSLKRLRETGMRKVMGSSKRSIVLQFFLEALILTTVAIIISLGLLEILLPVLNDVLALSLGLSSGNIAEIAVLSLALALLISMMAGGYPALYLSSYKTVSAVKGIVPSYQRRLTLRNALVVVQFVVSVSLIIGVMVASRQIRFMKSADLGFNRDNVLVVDLNSGFQEPKQAAKGVAGIISELRQHAGVLSVCISQNVPGRYWENYNGFIPEGNSDPIGLRQANVGDQYLQTYDIRILEGRNFSPAIPSDTLHRVMINRAAMKALGWKSAVGKTLRSNGSPEVYTVIGVFDDFHYRSLQGNIQPLIHFYGRKVENASFLSIKLMPGTAPEIISLLQEEWKSLGSWLGLNYFFIDEEFDLQYKSVERTVWLIGVFTAVAIILSCSGIFALSAIVAQQRTKEIGIRKVLGASVANIVRLLSKDFLRLVIIAMVLAAPLAWYGMSAWLQDFAYRISIEWWVFAAAGTVALLIAFFTTGVQSVKAALNNPVDSLHND